MSDDTTYGIGIKRAERVVMGAGASLSLPNAAGAASFAVAGGAATGAWTYAPSAVATFEAVLSNTTTPAATVEIHGSNSSTTVPGAGTRLGTITLSGALDVASFSTTGAVYRYKCAKVTAISGVSATVTVTMGV